MAKKKEDGEEKAPSQMSPSDLVAMLNKQKPGSIITGKELEDMKQERVKTGILTLDRLTGGGLVRGTITHIFGPPSTTKSSSIINCIGYNQQINPDFFTVVVNIEGYWNAESMKYIRNFGVDPDRVLLIEEKSPEVALTIYETVVESNAVDLAIIDSAAGVVSNAELEKALTETEKVAEQAKFIRRFLRRLTAKSQSVYSKESKTRRPNKTAMVILNQVTHTLNKYDPYTTTGGDALHFFSAIEIETDIPSVKDNIFYAADKKKVDELGNTIEAKSFARKAHIGQSITYTITKNRTAKTKSWSGKTDFYNQNVLVPSMTGFTGFGFDVIKDAVELGVQYGLVEVSGSYYSVADIKVQGKEKFMAAVREDSEIRDLLISAVEQEIENEFKDEEG